MPRSRIHLPSMALALALGSPVVHSQDPGNTRASTPVQIQVAVQPLAQALNDLAQQARLGRRRHAVSVDRGRPPGAFELARAADRVGEGDCALYDSQEKV